MHVGLLGLWAASWHLIWPLSLELPAWTCALALVFASLVAQAVKNMPAIHETWVGFLGWEDPLEKEMAIHSSIRAWRILWMGSLVCFLELQESDMI